VNSHRGYDLRNSADEISGRTTEKTDGSFIFSAPLCLSRGSVNNCGRKAGRAEMLGLPREKLVRVPRTRFQTEPPAELVTVVQERIDPVLLGQWFDRALDASSLEEVRAGLGLSR
jgi:hypothetical protein